MGQSGAQIAGVFPGNKGASRLSDSRSLQKVCYSSDFLSLFKADRHFPTDNAG
ncbi:hypothetical protein CLOSTMETH_01591 [[Clostridium] methylpentosum DSM 5476]|uniref:Uncharacterized protein n=1 Tax=[Clostridium] methylpentosum DSM 5476 TaxID=537013 RepID=C0ECM0_9FIRM|nr:hypothetical protein CLOSTMETH_01591 [[Clostridium] methylpentosum DSM 5476]